MRIRNSTIINNGLTSGANIAVMVPADSPGESLLVENSIISRATSPRPNCDINAVTTNYPLLATNSIVDDASCGGFSWTHALSPLSPAIDAGLNSICPALDPRSLPRPVQKVGASATCDLGAVEEQ